MKKVRRYDIDWIRILVFDFLIIFHVGMFFNDWDWHIKNNQTVGWLKYPMYFLSQWRIPILFVVSGIGTRFALSFRDGNQYIKERFTRLFIPLLIGIFVTVLPQVYLERLADGSFEGNLFAFFPHFFEGIYPHGNFSWHHLWFLPYLLVMSLVGTPLFLVWRKEDNAFVGQLQRGFEKSKWCIYLFVIPLFLIEVILGSQFPITHAFWGDWYALASYFLLFISGFLLIRIGEPFWKSVHRLRWMTLLIGVIAFSLMMWGNKNGIDQMSAKAFLKTVNMWSWILAIFGFAAQYLNKKSAIVKYRNEAVYPFYIFHQAITISIGFWLMNHPMPIFWKFLIMVIGTFGGSWILMEIVKQVRFLRPLFGLKNK
ncbi:MAG: acyltransferase family protein [Chitinophagales bacterium]